MPEVNPRTRRAGKKSPAASRAEAVFMTRALGQAKKAASEGEVPVGAVVVFQGRIIGRGRNRSVSKNDPTAHAEIMAIRQACRLRKNYRITDCEIFVTLEPCAMCLGAIVQARIRRLIYGAEDPKSGAVRSVMSFPFLRLNHRPEISGGVLSGESADLLKKFFKDKRRKAASGTERPPG